jgi:hypothetical protein
VIVILLVAQYSSSELSPLDDLSPQELIDTGIAPGSMEALAASSGAVPVGTPAIPAVSASGMPLDTAASQASVPLSVVSKFTSELEQQNQRLMSQNKALSVEKQVSKAKDRILIAAGLEPPKTLEEKKEAAKAKVVPKTPPKQELKPEMKKGLTVIDSLMDRNKKLSAELTVANQKSAAEQQQEIRTTEANRKKVEKLEAIAAPKIEAAVYHTVPFFKFDTASKTVPGQSQQQCQTICDAQSKCQSISYSFATKTCVWSVDSVGYDAAFTLHVKAQTATEGKPEEKWHSFPGLKFVADAPSSKKFKEKISDAECKSICEKQADCRSYSYKQTTKYCAWSSAGLTYTNDFNYLEKSKAHIKKMEEKHRKEKEKEEAELKASEKLSKHKEKQEMEANAKENAEEKKERQNFLNSMPTKKAALAEEAQVETDLKKMDAKLAAADAHKKDVANQERENEYEKFNLASMAKVARMESSIRQLTLGEQQAQQSVAPLAAKESAAKAGIAKKDTQIKVNQIEIQKQEGMKNKEVAVARQASSEGDEVVATQAAAAEKHSQGIINADTDKMNKAKAEEAMLQGETAQLTSAFKQAEMKASTTKADLDAKEASMKVQVKKEKETQAKMRLAFAKDSVKAATSQIVALQAKEVLAKTTRAKAKVKHYEALEDLKASNDETRAPILQRAVGQANGEIFEANKQNKELVAELMKVSQKMASHKEMLHKADEAVKNKAKKQKADAAMKMASLEANALPKFAAQPKDPLKVPVKKVSDVDTSDLQKYVDVVKKTAPA